MDKERCGVSQKLLEFKRGAVELTRLSREGMVKTLMAPDKYRSEAVEQLLKVVQREADGINNPKNFYLKETKTWFRGILLGRLPLFPPTGRAKVMLLTVYDINKQQFRFCGEFKQVLYERKSGFQLEDPEETGHELFFAKATREQQQILLLAVLGSIFKIRQEELAFEPSIA